MDGTTGLGMITGKVDVTDSNQTAVNPGGVPIYKNGEVAGGVGVVGSTPDVSEFAAFSGAASTLPTVPCSGSGGDQRHYCAFRPANHDTAGFLTRSQLTPAVMCSGPVSQPGAGAGRLSGYSAGRATWRTERRRSCRDRHQRDQYGQRHAGRHSASDWTADEDGHFSRRSGRHFAGSIPHAGCDRVQH